MIAYHGDPVVKQTYIDRVWAHHRADEIVNGTYWQHGKGCAVGCSVHSDDHAAYERELGLPTWLARLEDSIFEALYKADSAKAKVFPARFLELIPVGADVSGVRDLFLAWLMDSPDFGLAHHAREEEIKALAGEVASRLRTGVGVDGPEADELTKRLSAARDAWAAWAARAARDAWAAWAAWAARDAWDARAAWAARAARDARDAFVVASAEELLRLLAAAPIPVAA